jgi:hypothetical protein
MGMPVRVFTSRDETPTSFVLRISTNLLQINCLEAFGHLVGTVLDRGFNEAGRRVLPAHVQAQFPAKEIYQPFRFVSFHPAFCSAACHKFAEIRSIVR